MNAARIDGRIAAELIAARSARDRKNEGQARVCARRAAGLAAALYLSHRNQVQTPNAYAALRKLQELDDIPETIRQAAGRLTARVTRDFVLPHPQDPLDDAELVIRSLVSDLGEL